MGLRVNKPRGEDGFTLVEMLIGLVVVAILFAVAIPTFNSARWRSKNTTMKGAAQVIATAAGQYNGDWPIVPAQNELQGTTNMWDPLMNRKSPEDLTEEGTYPNQPDVGGNLPWTGAQGVNDLAFHGDRLVGLVDRQGSSYVKDWPDNPFNDGDISRHPTAGVLVYRTTEPGIPAAAQLPGRITIQRLDLARNSFRVTAYGETKRRQPVVVYRRTFNQTGSATAPDCGYIGVGDCAGTL